VLANEQFHTAPKSTLDATLEIPMEVSNHSRATRLYRLFAALAKTPASMRFWLRLAENRHG
jgi:hypothetical protein